MAVHTLSRKGASPHPGVFSHTCPGSQLLRKVPYNVHSHTHAIHRMYFPAGWCALHACSQADPKVPTTSLQGVSGTATCPLL